MSDISHIEILNEKLKRKYEFTITQSHIAQKIEEKLLEQQKTFSVSGFRKGKAPMHIVKRYKEKDIANSTISDQIKITSDDFFKEHNMIPVITPKISDVTFDKDLKYTIEAELRPETPLFKIEQLGLSKENVDINDTDITKHMEFLSTNCFDLIKATTSHKIKEGDVVYIDFIGKVDNKVFEGGTGKDFMVIVGADTVLPEIEQGLIDCSEGNELTIAAEFPQDYPMKPLAEKQAQFSVKIKKIMRKKQITDKDQILKHFHCKTEDELKDKATQDLHKKCDAMIDTIARKEIIDHINSNFSFDVPEMMVEAEINKISAQIDDKTKITEKAKERVRLGFLLLKAAQEKSISVTEDDISRALINKANGDQRNMNYIIDVYKNNPQASIELKGEILEKKVMKLMIDSFPTKVTISIQKLEEQFNAIEG